MASAFADYKNLTKFLKTHPDSRVAKRNLEEVKEFLFSDRFKAISDIDVPYMLKKIDDFLEGGEKDCISVGVF